MTALDFDTLAVALARYVGDVLPATASGTAVLPVGTLGGIGVVYGKPGGRATRSRCEALLAGAGVAVLGRGFSPRGDAWAVVVRGTAAGPLADALDAVVGRPTPLAARRLRQWAEWHGSLSG